MYFLYLGTGHIVTSVPKFEDENAEMTKIDKYCPRQVISARIGHTALGRR